MKSFDSLFRVSCCLIAMICIAVIASPAVCLASDSPVEVSQYNQSESTPAVNVTSLLQRIHGNVAVDRYGNIREYVRSSRSVTYRTISKASELSRTNYDESDGVSSARLLVSRCRITGKQCNAKRNCKSSLKCSCGC